MKDSFITEAVARLKWRNQLNFLRRFAGCGTRGNLSRCPPNGDRLKPLRSQSSPLREFQRYLLELSDQDAAGYDLSVPNALATGWRILELFLKCLVGRSEVRLEEAAAELQEAWAPKRSGAG